MREGGRGALGYCATAFCASRTQSADETVIKKIVLGNCGGGSFSDGACFVEGVCLSAARLFINNPACCVLVYHLDCPQIAHQGKLRGLCLNFNKFPIISV